MLDASVVVIVNESSVVVVVIVAEDSMLTAPVPAGSMLMSALDDGEVMSSVAIPLVKASY